MKQLFLLLCTLACLAMLNEPAHANQPLIKTTMVSSWYGPGFQGNDMANGKPFDMDDLTVVANKEMAFGTVLLLTNPKNGKSIAVVVQDRGPYVENRELDVSKAVAEKLEFIDEGTAKLIVVVAWIPGSYNPSN